MGFEPRFSDSKYFLSIIVCKLPPSWGSLSPSIQWKLIVSALVRLLWGSKEIIHVYSSIYWAFPTVRHWGHGGKQNRQNPDHDELNSHRGWQVNKLFADHQALYKNSEIFSHWGSNTRLSQCSFIHSIIHISSNITEHQLWVRHGARRWEKRKDKIDWAPPG